MSHGAVLSRVPFKLLDYFTENDPVPFAGREQDISEVVSRALADRTFVLYGRSGLGKTSLLLAGVFPHFGPRGYLPVLVRLLDDPMADLRSALAAQNVGKTSASDSLDALVNGLPGSAGVLLAFDQFEEFFIRNRKDPDVRRTFIRELVGLLDRSPRHLRVLFSLREDFLAEMDDFRADDPDILGNIYRLRPLTAFGARQAIIAPLQAAQIKFSEQLVRKLVDFLAQEQFDPLVLQIACHEVYRAALSDQRTAELREADLDSIGGIDKLFDRYLKYAVDKLSPEFLVLSRAILDALITSEGTKRTVTVDNLLANEDFRASKEEIESVLDDLKKRRLVREESRHGQLWYELAHDRLAPAIVKWFNDDENFSQFRDARGFVSVGLRDDFRGRQQRLLSESQFGYVQKYRERLRLVPPQPEFLFWSAVLTKAKAEDIKYWAGLVPREACLDALKALLKHNEGTARLGASLALPALPDIARVLAAECAAAALDDPDPSVRRAAGQALARLDGGTEVEKIKARLRRKPRQPAIEVLADLRDAGQSLRGFPFWWRWLGHKESSGRAIERHRQALVGRSRRAAVVGVLAGFAWALVIGVPLLATEAWSTWKLDWLGSIGLTAAYLALAAMLAGAYFGRRLAKLSAKRAALTSDGRWFEASLRDWLAPLLVFAIFLFSNRFEWWQGLLGALGFSLLSGVFVGILRPAVWPPTPRPLTVLMGIAAGLVPMAALIVALNSGSLKSSQVLRELSIILAGFLSFLSCTRVMAMAESTQAHPIGTPAPVSRRLRWFVRAAAGLAALAVIPLHVATYGTPWWTLASPAIAAGNPIPLPSRGSGYVKVFNAGAPTWYEVKGLPESAELRVRKDQNERQHTHTEEQTLFFAAAGRTLGAIIGQANETHGGDLTLQALPELADQATIRLSANDRVPYLLRLRRDGRYSTPSWAGKWTFDIPEPPAGSSVSMVLPDLVSEISGRLEESAAAVPQFANIYVPLTSASTTFPKSLDRTLNGLTFTIESDRIVVALRATFERGAPEQDEILAPVVLSLITDAPKYFREGNQLLFDRKYEEAFPKLEQAVRLDPRNPDYLNGLAWVLISRTVVDKAPFQERAVQLARTATQLQPSTATFFDTLAHAEFLSQNWKGARDAWDTVYTLQPGYYDPDPVCVRDRDLRAIAAARAKGAK